MLQNESPPNPSPTITICFLGSVIWLFSVGTWRPRSSKPFALFFRHTVGNCFPGFLFCAYLFVSFPAWTFRFFCCCFLFCCCFFWCRHGFIWKFDFDGKFFDWGESGRRVLPSARGWDHFGKSTQSMTWITPLHAATSALMTFE